MNAFAASRVRRNVRLYYLYGFLMDFALWAGIWIKYLILDRGFALKWILGMDLPFWLLVAVLQAPTGALADHIGRKRVLALAGVSFAITIIGFGLATNYWLLFFDYLVWAVAQSLRSGADSALLYDSLREAGQESGFQRIAGRGFAVTIGSSMVAIALGGFLAQWLGLARVVQISAVAPLLAVAAALAMHEPASARVERRYLHGLAQGVSFAWRHPEVRYTLLMGSVLLAGTFGPVILMQPFLIKHDVSTALFGVYQAPLKLVSIGAALVAFRVARRTGVGSLLVAACATIIVAYCALALVDAQVAFVLFALPALMTGLTRPVIDGYLNERIPSDRRATVLSTMSLVFALQVAFFEPALGQFTDGISLTAAFVFAAAYFIVLMPPLLLLWRRAQGATPGGQIAMPVEAAAGS
jgi:MFS family permease